ncbi:MAG: hypothetical protein IMZ61_03215 [Planctomycetes bacterium]|nr:hypothetical protein [Planctomycetota bacterium]
MKCSVCGFEVKDEPKIFTFGLEISIFGNHEEASRTRTVFGDGPFKICYCCWLKALGVKPKETDAEQIDRLLKPKDALPPGYKIITRETFVKELFEWTLNKDGRQIDGKITITRQTIGEDGKIDKIYGTREYRKE